MGAVISIDGTQEITQVMVTLDRHLFPDSSRIYKSFGEAAETPIAQKCFAIPGVTELHFSQNYIRVSRDSENDWSTMVPALKRVINFHFEREDKKAAKKKEG